jgi:transposase
MKSARARMDIVNAYAELGSYRAAAAVCGTTHKTVKRIVERQRRGEPERSRPSRAKNVDGVRELIAERVRASAGRISAKRLLSVVRGAGYAGSGRSLRRAVAEAKATWRKARRVYRPWVPLVGEHLVIDWGSEGGSQQFCAVLAWSRYRFVRFAADQQQATTLRLLAECFEELGGVPAVVLADRMGCLKGGTVANVVVPHPEYVRFAAQYGFRPDFCEAADPESKGVVEALVGYAQRDLIVPQMTEGGWSDLGAANAAARAWCAEVNGRVHSEIMAIPAERLLVERERLRPLPSLRPAVRAGAVRKVDRLATVRFGSARYSVPHALVGTEVTVTALEGAVLIRQGVTEVARHALVGPGEVAIRDEHYGEARPRPSRAIRPRTAAEVAFLGLGPIAEAFLRAAAAAGTARLEAELGEIAGLAGAWGREALVKALDRATRFRRFRAADVRAILVAGAGVPIPTAAGAPLAADLPTVPVRPLSAYAVTPSDAAREVIG